MLTRGIMNQKLKIYTALIIWISISFSGFAQDENEILQRIQPPSFPFKEFNITRFQKKSVSADDWKPAFDKAVQACAKNHGGRIVVPEGIYFLKGPIHFTSNVELHLEKGAVLKFSSDPSDYPLVKTSWEGTLLYNFSPFIYGYQLENVAITGEGTIDGEASETWSKWSSLQSADQMLSRDMNHQNVPVEKRIFGQGHYLRPHLIQFYDCRNILMENVKIEDSPFWCIHLLMCKNATLRGIRYDAKNKNNDGIDPEYSEDVLIENISFNNGDDNVAIKSGRDDEGRTIGRESKNIIIRNCNFKGLHAVVIGSEMSGGVHDVFVENCSFAGKLKRGIYLKSNPDRGGAISRIFVKNVSFGEVEDCFYITTNYHNEGKGHATDIHDVFISNITCNKATANGILVEGYPEKKVHDLYFSNIHIDTAAVPVKITDAERIRMKDVWFGPDK